MNVYQHAATVRQQFEEYRKLARLVDDLDIRFWKRFVLRNRIKSIDHELAEDVLREEYKSCVADLMYLHRQITAALDSITSMADRAIISDYYIRDMPIPDIMEKWNLKEYEVHAMIQHGLMEVTTQEEIQGKINDQFQRNQAVSVSGEGR